MAEKINRKIVGFAIDRKWEMKPIQPSIAGVGSDPFYISRFL